MKTWVAIAAGAACALAGGVLALQYVRTTKRVNEEGIRVAILGTGWGVKVQVALFRIAGLNVVAIYSRDQERADELAAKHKMATGYSDVKKLCESPEVDLVSIVTPPYLHLQHFKDAMEAGRHVLVDKPMCLNSAEAEEMLRIAKARPNQLAIVDHELRFSPHVLRAKELIWGGALGTIGVVSCEVMIPSGAGPWSWWSDAASGGGVLGAIGTHLIDQIRFLLPVEVARVSAHLHTLVKQKPDAETKEPKAVTSDDVCSIRMVLKGRQGAAHPNVLGDATQHDDGIMASMLMVLYGKPPIGPRNKTGLTIIGTKGSVELESVNSTMTHYGPDLKVKEVVRGGGNAFALVGTRCLGEALQRALGPQKDKSALADAATIADGVVVTYVVDACKQSAAAGGSWVEPKSIA